MDNIRAGLTASHDIEALQRKLAAAHAELAAARREQAATAEVLRIVSRSTADAAPVFDAIMEACLRLFDPYDAAIYQVDGDSVKGAARRGFADGDWGADATPLAGSSTGRAIAERRPVHIVDLADVPGLPEDKRLRVKAHGGLTTLYAPVISGERGVGSLVVARRPKRAFTEAEIVSLSAFADQAVIAIQNARLFDEVQAKTRELSEAIVYQTGGANILKVIASSPTKVAPVLQAIVDSACEVCPKAPARTPTI